MTTPSPYPQTAIEAVWGLLDTGNRFYRAAAILLLKALTTEMVANGQGEAASELVKRFREADRFKSRHREGRMRP
jgi:hypothetical protein